jgi:hypothetical protein
MRTQNLLLGIAALFVLASPLKSQTPDSNLALLPWKEFLSLYREHLENQWRQTETRQPTALIHLESCDYDIFIEKEMARIRIRILGTVTQGVVSPFPFLSPETRVIETGACTNARFVRSPDGALALLPKGNEPSSFEATLEIVAPRKVDEISPYIEWKTSAAVRNTASVSRCEDLRIHPDSFWTPVEPDRFALPGNFTVRLRFESFRNENNRSPLDIRTLSRIESKSDRLHMTTWIFPNLTQSPEPISVLLPPDATLLGVVPNSAFLGDMDSTLTARTISVRLDSEPVVLHMAFASHRDNDGKHDKGLPISPPQIANNLERPFEFCLVANEGFRLSPRENLGITEIRATPEMEALANTLQQSHMAKNGGMPAKWFSASGATPVSLCVQTLDSIATPQTVLDNIVFHTEFAENGRSLSTVAFSLAGIAGSHWTIPAIPDAKIWHLKVDGQQTTIYTDETENWIIPLKPGANRQIELSYMNESHQLGVTGKLDAHVPALGMPARNVSISFTLPERIELASVEGPVSSTNQVAAPKGPNNYRFSSPFYDGNRLNISILYREPTQ